MCECTCPEELKKHFSKKKVGLIGVIGSGGHVASLITSMTTLKEIDMHLKGLANTGSIILVDDRPDVETMKADLSKYVEKIEIDFKNHMEQADEDYTLKEKRHRELERKNWLIASSQPWKKGKRK